MFWNIIIGIASFLLNLVLSPKPQNAKAASLEDFNIPVAEEGIEIPVLFGTVNLRAPNCVWYGDLKVTDIKGARRYGFFGPRQVIGHKYSLGMHMILCHGVHDEVRQIWAGDKQIFGSTDILSSVDILYGSVSTYIDLPDLFGGEEREGGIVGTVTFMDGNPAQGVNAYLASKMGAGADTPAFRGVVSAVLERPYLSTTPYIKPWEFFVKRIHKTSQGVEQWYDAKSEVPDSFSLGTATGFDMFTVGGHQISSRQVMTKNHWVAMSETGHDPETWVWDLRDQSVRHFTVSGFVVIGGYCYITDDDELITVHGGDAWGSPGLFLQFRDLNDPGMRITQTIELTPHMQPVQINSSLSADEIEISGTKYMFIEIYPFIAFRGPHLVLRKTSGFWHIIASDRIYPVDEVTPLTHWGETSMGTQYVYASGGSWDVSMVEWAGFSGTDIELPETRIVPPGITEGLGGDSISTVAYNQATDEVIVVSANGWIRIYNADITTLLRSGQPVPSNSAWAINNYRGLGSYSVLLNANSILIHLAYATFSSVSYSFNVVNLTTFEIETTIPVPGSALLHNTIPINMMMYNATHGGVVFYLGGFQNFVTFWPLIADALDMNPAHIIRECLTDKSWGMGYADADVDDVSFAYAADTLYNECFGLSLLWSREERIEQFITLILSHIDGYLYLRRDTGKFYLKLVRLDYDINTIPVYTEDEVITWEEVQRRTPAEAINSVTVKYVDRRNRGKDASVSFDNIAQIQQQGERITTTQFYPGISRGGLASQVAGRNVKTLGIGMISGRVSGTRAMEELYPGDPFRLVSDRHNLDGEVMRAAEMRFGDGRTNKVGVKFVQDVFSLGAADLIDTVQGDWENPMNPPAAVVPRLTWEMPYQQLLDNIGPSGTDTMLIEDPDAGMLEVAGSKPSVDSLDAGIYVDTVYFDRMSFSPGGELSVAVGALDTSIILTDDVDLDLIEVGDLAVFMEVGEYAAAEAIRITAVAGTTLTIERGMLDTTPRSHIAGAVVIIFGTGPGSDFEQRTSGDSILVELSTRTSLGSLSLAAAPDDTVVFDNRAIRPLRPAGILVDGEAEGPVDATGLTDVPVEWFRRNRITEAVTPVAWTDPDETPEAGQDTVIEVLDDDLIVLTTHSALSGTSFDVPVASFSGQPSGYIRVGSERDGYREWQAYAVPVLVDADFLEDDGDALTDLVDTLYIS